MSEEERTFITRLKKWIFGLLSGIVLLIVAQVFVTIRSSAVNDTKMINLEKEQVSIKSTLKEKASLTTLKAVKGSLQTEIKDKFDIISEKLDLVLELTRGDTYNYKPRTTNNE